MDIDECFACAIFGFKLNWTCLSYYFNLALREARKRDIENNVNKILEEAKESEKKSSEKTGNNIVFEEDEYEGELEEDDFDEDLEGEYITNFYDDEFDAFEDAAEDGEYLFRFFWFLAGCLVIIY